MSASSARARRAIRRNAVQAAEREIVRTKAVGYLRVSTEEQAQSGFGLDAQEDAVRKFADATGLELIDVVADPGISGTTRPADRPGFSRIVELAAERRFSVLLVKRFDRLARNIALAVFEENGAGRTVRAIADGLNRDGLASPKGGKWWPGTVSYVLNNQVYAGRTEVVFVTSGAVTHVNRQGAHARIVR